MSKPIGKPADHTPQDLLERIRRERLALAMLWANLSEEEIGGHPGPYSDWSVKDLVVHITWWENYSLRQISDMLDGESGTMVVWPDALDDNIIFRYRDRPWADVLADFDALLPKIEANLERIAALIGHAPEDATALLNILAKYTVDHYADHHPGLADFVQSRLDERSG